MVNKKISRRKLIGSSSVALLGVMSGYGFKAGKEAGLVPGASKSAEELPFRISLNTSTIRAYNLSVEEQIDAVAEAGFDGIELWVRDVQAYLNEGGTYESISERLKDRNLVLENMIGFSQWASDDAGAREQAIEKLKQDMLLTAKLGGKYIAAPVMGLNVLDKSKYEEYSQRFLAIVELSDRTGVVPILELWGHGPISRVADGAYMVIATGHPNATMLLDFYHLYRGGNYWETLDYINCGKLPIFHINDFPGNVPREQLNDSDRIFPGDGICPFNELIPKLYMAGFRGAFSVELFNQDYWDEMDVQTILKESHDRTLKVLQESMTGTG